MDIERLKIVPCGAGFTIIGKVIIKLWFEAPAGVANEVWQFFALGPLMLAGGGTLLWIGFRK